MRPKKIIFLFSSDEDQRSTLAYLLWTRSYEVRGGLPPQADMALIVHDWRNSEDSIAAARALPQMDPPLPLLVVVPKLSEYFTGLYPAHARFLTRKTPPAEMLEWIRIALARKRGPKKKPVKKQEAEQMRAVMA